MINIHENETENERYDINRRRSRHEHKYAKYKMCHGLSIIKDVI